MDLVETKDPSAANADPYNKMASLIVHNAGQPFGGAFVITPPGDNAEVITSLFLNQSSLGMFWATLKTICEQQLLLNDEVERRGRAGFGAR